MEQEHDLLRVPPFEGRYPEQNSVLVGNQEIERLSELCLHAPIKFLMNFTMIRFGLLLRHHLSKWCSMSDEPWVMHPT